MNSYIWIHVHINSCMNSESIHLNWYTLMHILMNSYIIHFIYEFMFIYEFICYIWIHAWIHMYILISYMNSHNDSLNLHMYMNSYMNSYESYVCEFIWFFHIWIHMFHEFIYEFGCSKVPDEEGRLCRTCAEERELPRAEQKERAWSMAAAGTSELSAASAASSESRQTFPWPVNRNDVGESASMGAARQRQRLWSSVNMWLGVHASC